MTLSTTRYALRNLRAAPAYTAAAVLTLALGVGAVTAAFGVVNSLYLLPLPYADADRLVVLHEAEPQGDPEWSVSPADLTAWRVAGTLQSIAAYNQWRPIVSTDDGSERIDAAIVTPDFFAALGAIPAIGPGLDPASTGEETVVVLSHGFWRSRFGADPGVIGRELRVNGRPYTIAGVMPAAFRHPDPSTTAAFWAPVRIDPTERSRFLHLVGRLSPGATPEQAGAELDALADAMAEENPATNAGWGATVHGLRDELFGQRRGITLLLLAAAAIVLLIACVNVANLTMARHARRRHEFAVRAALGADGTRLVTQVITEAALIALAGGIVGLGIVLAAKGALAGLGAVLVSPAVRISIDARVFAFVLGTCGCVALLFGAVPARSAARAATAGTLHEGGRGAAGGRAVRRTRALPIATEIALASALLVCLALVGRSYLRLTSVPTGFEAQRVLTADIAAPSWRYPEPAQAHALYELLLERARDLSGVESAALISDLPFTSENRFEYVRVDGAPHAPQPPLVEFQVVSSDLPRTLGVPLLEGRDFDARDTGDAPRVLLVNRAFAERHVPDGRIIGRTMRLGGDDFTAPFQIVGLIDDVLDDGYAIAPEPRLYAPWSQWGGRGMTVLLRSTGDPLHLAPLLRAVVRDIDPEVPVGTIRTLASVVDDTVAPRRGGLVLVALFGLLAVALAAVGVYGVCSYAVSGRTRELGVRLALGADPLRLLGTVLSEAFAAGAIGVTAGTVLGVAAGFAIRTTLFGITPLDLPSLMLPAGAALAVTGLAALRPARRAARTPASEALRME